ncbi:MAG TPA: serine protease [Polyangiaceae bacterium]|nr:serine protease [Polyangiaceae bacterium]
MHTCRHVPSLLAMLFLACGGSQPGAHPSGTGVAPHASRAAGPGAEAGPSGAIPGGTRVPSPKLLDRRARTAVAPDTLGLVKSAKPPPKSSSDLYRLVAPATVIVRVPGGMGTGVVIDPKGWIVTNHHVIEHGKSEDFQKSVSVVLGSIDQKSGGMARQDKALDAVVYKSDPLRDLALLKLTNPPAKLPYVRLGKENPVPGQSVHAIGHAGAGMLWALKTGEISALGKLSEQLASLAQFKDDDKGKESAEKFKKYLDDRNLGLVIQSTCNILPGDSGGPLVSDQGELIGLNAFSNRDGKTGGLLSFHIHRSEVADFVKKRPSKPAQMLPNPWKDGGGDASYEDVDLDGRVDALLLQGRRPCSFCPRQSAAVFVDIDQDSFQGKTLPPLTEVYEKQRFDAELIYLQVERNSYIWYDTDNDGKMDVLLVDDGMTGRPRTAYKISNKEELTKDDSLRSGRILRPALFQNAALRPRFDRIANAAFPSRYVDSSGASADALPEPLGATGTALALDSDGDGKRDTLRVTTAFSTRILLDLDGNSIGRLPARTTADKIDKAFDAEVSIVSQGNHMWVWYDTDDDGRFDLALHSPGSRLYVAASAQSVDAGGARTAVSENVGRKLIRAELLAKPEHAQALRKLIGKSFLKLMSASGGGIASFPHPYEDHRGAGFELLDVAGLQKSVVVINAQGSDGYLVDLDRNSLANKSTKGLDLRKLVRDGKFDAEYAYFQRNGLAWAFYDTNNSGKFDVVLYSSKPRSGKAELGFRIGAKDSVSLDASLTGSALVTHSLIKNRASRARLEKLAQQLFGGKALE